MPVEASIGELQALGKEKLNELYQQVADQQSALDKVTVERKQAEQSLKAIQDQQEGLKDELDALNAKITQAKTSLTEAQSKTLTRLQEAEADAEQALEKAQAAQRVLEQTRGQLHSLKERVRGVLLDALTQSNDRLTSYTTEHAAITTELDELFKLVDNTEIPAPVPDADNG